MPVNLGSAPTKTTVPAFAGTVFCKSPGDRTYGRRVKAYFFFAAFFLAFFFAFAMLALQLSG
jgi:hypothetical protein